MTHPSEVERPARDGLTEAQRSELAKVWPPARAHREALEAETARKAVYEVRKQEAN